MSEAKTIALATVLKFEKPFKVAHIYQLSGLSRELSRYHVLQLVEEGFLEKNGVWYSIKDKDGLINALARQEEPPSRRTLNLNNVIINKDKSERLNNRAKFSIAMRMLDLPCSEVLKRAMVEEINETIKSLRDFKSYINAGEMSQRKSALEILDVMGGLESVYDSFTELHPHIGKKEWVDKMKNQAIKLENLAERKRKE